MKLIIVAIVLITLIDIFITTAIILSIKKDKNLPINELREIRKEFRKRNK